jgi:4-hydroxy-tetrahydrodipicolinate synthase
MNTKISGAFTAIVTPFNLDGSLNEKGLRENIRFQIENRVDGIVILGTTGEAPTLTHAEKLRIMRTAIEEAGGKIHLMVGTGSYSTQQTIENTLEAEHAGADSVLVVTPYYNKPTQEGLYLHYANLAKSTNIPIVIYNIQGRTGQNLETATLKRLAGIPNIIGVKEASGNIAQMMEVIETLLPVRPDFSVMSGDDALAFPLMALGGHGVYSVLGNLYPDQVKDLCKAALNGDYSQARELHYSLLPLIRNLFIETNPIPVKAAMNLLGMAAGPCRLPLCEMSYNNFEKIKSSFNNTLKSLV